MLGRALLQTSLLLWLVQQTLQGAIKPQSVSWGRVMPARSVGIGVKPGVTGALGALGNRYGSKAMKAGLGRYSGAQLGHGGYRSLGLGGRAGLKQGGYATPGAYGASLGTGMPLGTGLTNGVGLGQGARRVYGGGVGALPGYGALAGIGYPGARPGTGLGYHTGQKAKEQKPGVSTANLGGPEIASLGQAAQDLKREKSSQSYGHRAVGLEIPNTGRSNVLGPEAGHRETKSLDPVLKASSLGPLTPLDKQRKILAQGGGSYDPTLLERRGSVNHGSTLAARGVRPQLPLIQTDVRTQGSSQVQHTGEYESLIHQNQQRPNCGSSRDLSGVLGINHHELLGAEAQRTPGLVPRPHVGKESKHLGLGLQQAQGERNYQPLLPLTQDVKSGVYALSQGQASRSILSAVADGQAVRDLGPSAKDTKGPRTHGAIAVENLNPGSLNVHVQGSRSLGPVSARGTQNAGITSLGRQEGEGVTVDGQEQKPISHTDHDVIKPKALNIPGEAGGSDQATSYIGGAGNYLGAGLGAGGYGAGLGQGAYLGATGKHGGYGEGATGYLGALAGNGYGYGNGYSDGYGAGLSYPAELSDGAELKAKKNGALSTGAYAGQVQGAYGALGTGLDSTGGKYVGGAAQVPYASAPVIPTGLEGDGGYPYPAQQLALGAEGAKTTSKLGEVAAAGYGAQQTGFGAQLGATQDALAGQPGKFGVDGALDTGYKG